ncbi:hypothetical protein [Haloglomus litoreum]|uniref:hypothetical protein n=1 Tax=Haloglomus litoreum TaxID=3034026 RepID=UPI0023E86326|nr:hypothetical protein [Haloglomus sp. DT116]
MDAGTLALLLSCLGLAVVGGLLARRVRRLDRAGDGAPARESDAATAERPTGPVTRSATDGGARGRSS